jgi:hypothetical protein
MAPPSAGSVLSLRPAAVIPLALTVEYADDASVAVLTALVAVLQAGLLF